MEHGLVTDIAISSSPPGLWRCCRKWCVNRCCSAYLVAGFALVAARFKWVTDVRDIATISEIGLSLLCS